MKNILSGAWLHLRTPENPLDLFSRFDRTSTCDTKGRHRQTDKHTVSADSFVIKTRFAFFAC